jgi:xanthine dehydrogenase YagR molybdenum-binding subunit
MKSHRMDGPIGETRLDRRQMNILGQPVDRYEGPLKVTGRAPYAYEHDVPGAAHGFVVTAAIGKGTVEAVDTAAAERAPGVLAVIAGDDLPRAASQPQADAAQTMDGAVFHYAQPVAFVVAETFEAARHAARLVAVRYRAASGRHALDEVLGDAIAPDDGPMPSDVTAGDFNRAFGEAEVTVDATFTTPSQHAAAMEPHASIARWDGDRLTVWSSCQLAEHGVKQIANGLGVPVANVRLLTPYLGGGFGNKLGIGPEAVMAAMGARAVGRPVKVALTRQQDIQTTSRRSETVQRVRLGATRDGRLTAIGHETWCANSPGNGFFEPAGVSTVFLYAGANRAIRHRLATTDVLMTSSVRAPGEAVGMLALENAMDELAERLGLDPVELRRRNEPDVAPADGKPFSSRRLLDCIEEGARRFGWAERPKGGRHGDGRREGEWLIGTGFAVASRSNTLGQSHAAVTLGTDGRAVVRTAMTDIGTGTYTILQQIAAEMLGLPLDRVDVELGDTALPPSAGSGGSWGANSAGSSVWAACRDAIDELAARMGADPETVTFKNGEAVTGNRRVSLTDLLAAGPVEGTGVIQPGKAGEETEQASYGAHFAEVAVNAVTGETRVRRLLSVLAAGRIFNLKTATSQAYGGQIWGIGTALTEELVVDRRSGLLVNHDLAEYHVPVNADVPALEVVFLADEDPWASPLKGKGVGELGISGAGAAVTNAIHDACGVRVRDYPATPDKLLGGLPRL